MTIVFNEREQCASCPIRHRAICARCDDAELVQLEKIKSYKTFTAGQPIIWRGDELVTFASVVIGIASLSRTMEDGRTQMVGLLLPSDFIGRPGREIVEFDVTAVTEVTLCQFQRKPFEALVEEVPHISQRMMEMALDELNAAREWMVLLGRKTAREKIATFLEMIVRRSTMPSHAVKQYTLPLIVEFEGRRNFMIKDFAALQAASGDDADGGMIV